MKISKLQAVLAKHGVTLDEVMFSHAHRAQLPAECSRAVLAYEERQMEEQTVAQQNALEWQKERERGVRRRNDAVARNPFAALVVTSDGKVVMR